MQPLAHLSLRLALSFAALAPLSIASAQPLGEPPMGVTPIDTPDGALTPDIDPELDEDPIDPLRVSPSKTARGDEAPVAPAPGRVTKEVGDAEGKEFEDVAGPYRNFRGGIIIADAWEDEDPRKRWRLLFGGYLRIQYRAIQDDPEIDFVGRNDGFVYTNARPYFAGRMPNGLGWRFQFEAAAALPAARIEAPFQEKVVRPRDAFIAYEPIKGINLQFGQFKPPFNLEELQATADILFIDRSVGNDGVSRFAGRRLPGLSIEREVGVQATGQFYFTSPDDTPSGPGVAYGLAVTNGSPALDTFNDNDQLAYYGRASLLWSDIVSLGGGAYFNTITTINQQDDFSQDVLGYTADVSLNVIGVSLLASFTQRRDETEFLSDAQPNPTGSTFTIGRAYTAQLGYRIPVLDIQPAYRYSFYDPTASYNEVDPQAEIVRENDALTYHTIGLNYRGSTYPITVMLNYSIAGEQSGRELVNNRFDGLIQVTW